MSHEEYGAIIGALPPVLGTEFFATQMCATLPGGEHCNLPKRGGGVGTGAAVWDAVGARDGDGVGVGVGAADGVGAVDGVGLGVGAAVALTGVGMITFESLGAFGSA